MRLRVRACFSAIASIPSKPPSLFQATCFSRIRIRRIFSSVCVAATSLVRLSLRTRSRVMAKSAIIRRTSHSGIRSYFCFQTLVFQDESRVFKNSRSPVGLYHLHKVQAHISLKQVLTLFSVLSSAFSRRFLDRWYLTCQRSSWRS